MAMAAGRQTVVNAVHIIMYPSPANLLESREVLRVCQSFGEVTTFKHLKVSFVRCQYMANKPVKPWYKY